MGNLFIKELTLSASCLSLIFTGFGFMFFLPGYPVLCGAFFVTLGIFKSFQNYIETNDIIFSALLPVAKRDIIAGKYLFVCFIELVSMVIMAASAVIRNTVFVNASVYRNNALMNANCFALAMAFLIFALFNYIFVYGFFKTTYKRTKPFIMYIISAFVVIGIAEALHYVPGFMFLNGFGSEYLKIQLLLLLSFAIIYILVTYTSFVKACKAFERIDL